MEKDLIRSYSDLYSRYEPKEINKIAHYALSNMIYKEWKKYKFEFDTEVAEPVYCLALIILIKRYGTVERLQYDDFINDAKAALSIAFILHNHPYNDLEDSIGKYKDFTSKHKESIRDTLFAFRAELYIPTALDFFDVIQGIHQLLLPKDVAEARKSILYAYGSPFSLSVSPLDLAVAAIYYIQTILYHTVTTTSVYELSKNSIDQFHYCLRTSTLPKEYMNGRYMKLTAEYAPDDDILVKELTEIVDRMKTVVNLKDIKPLKPPQLLTKMGEGTFGKVFCAKRDLNKIVAYKTQKNEEHFIRELIMMSTFKHENIQSAIGFVFEDNAIEMTMQAYDLRYLLTTKLSKEDARKYTIQLFEGLSYLHNRGLLHGDIKPANILISDNKVLKIADFGSSMGFAIRGFLYNRDNRTIMYGTNYVTYTYRAYELLNPNIDKLDYSIEIDVWACGVIVLEMHHIIIHMNDFGDYVEEELLYNHIGKLLSSDIKISKLTSRMDKDLALLSMQCLNLNPKRRITASQALKLLI